MVEDKLAHVVVAGTLECVLTVPNLGISNPWSVGQAHRCGFWGSDVEAELFPDL